MGMKVSYMTQSEPFRFEELKVGDTFIDMPTDGDDEGHGGYRGAFKVFTKVDDYRGKRYSEDRYSHFGLAQRVILLQI